LVPPKPEEPDNCCMSGCVNCVWDLYRDDMEEWSAANTEAQSRLRAQEVAVAADSTGAVQTKNEGNVVQTKDQGNIVQKNDEGNVTQTKDKVNAMTKIPMDNQVRDPAAVDEDEEAWAKMGVTKQRDTGLAKDFWDDDLYKNVPVGIREFMKQEKRLKEKHLKEGTSGG
jgi:hypothetical protein